MRVYLLRHGIAEDGMGKPDADRAITPEGFKKLREVMKTLKAAGVAPTAVLSSPYLRAMQTAEVAVNDLGFQGQIEKVTKLTPDSSPRDAWGEIRLQKGQQEVLVVGHEPLFSSLTAFLLNSPSMLVDFKKGGVVAIDLASFTAQPHGVLCWYLTPKLASK
jgi:phosphohistidine phosphatase